jgi:hypothetical protein
LPSDGLGRHGLEDLEALELGMAEIERLVAAGVLVGVAERFRSRLFLELGPAAPDRVRGIERMVVVLRAAQEVELDEPGHRVEVDLTPSQTSSKSRSAPGLTWKRFIAMNINGLSRLGVVRGPDGIGQKDLT